MRRLSEPFTVVYTVLTNTVYTYSFYMWTTFPTFECRPNADRNPFTGEKVPPFPGSQWGCYRNYEEHDDFFTQPTTFYDLDKSLKNAECCTNANGNAALKRQLINNSVLAHWYQYINKSIDMMTFKNWLHVKFEITSSVPFIWRLVMRTKHSA